MFTVDVKQQYNTIRHFDIVSKYNVGLKILLLSGLSEPEFYGDLMYKFRKIIGKKIFLSFQKDNCSLSKDRL